MADLRAQEDREGLERQAPPPKLRNCEPWATREYGARNTGEQTRETLERKMLIPNQVRVIHKVTEGVA